MGSTRRTGAVGALALIWCLVLGAPVAARAADQEGTVVDVRPAEHRFTVRSGDGPKAVFTTFRTDDTTRITFGRKEVPFGNLVAGGRVSVRFVDRDLGPLATAVRIHRLDPR